MSRKYFPSAEQTPSPQLPSASSETTMMNRPLSNSLSIVPHTSSTQSTFQTIFSLYLLISLSFSLSSVSASTLSFISYVMNRLKLISCYRASVSYESRPQDLDAGFRGNCIEENTFILGNNSFSDLQATRIATSLSKWKH